MLFQGVVDHPLSEPMTERLYGMMKKMFKDLTPKQIDKLGHSLVTLAHLSAASLLFGQVTSPNDFDFGLATLGVLLLAWLYMIAVIVLQAGTRRKQKNK